ncbi:MAG TPA: rod shape-determining protein MreC [Smithellaceae bacterium]|nr:rod shape-determining protein MreC [Smithellaceae bacterium]
MFFFRNYKAIIFVVILLAAALLILSYNLRHKSSAGVATRIVLEAASPVQNILDTAVKSVSDAWSRYLFLVGIAEENARLRGKIDDLQKQLILYQESYLEAQRLRQLLDLENERHFNFAAARVIGRAQGVLSKTILINKGTSHGLKTGLPVLAGPGLVGRIVDVSWHSAKVLLLSDENSNIDALVQRNRTQGIIRGAGSQGYVLKYISKIEDVREGDTVISSGISGIFPKGLMIGRVSQVDKQEAGLFLKIRVTPSVDFSRLEELLVLIPDSSKEDKGGY